MSWRYNLACHRCGRFVRWLGEGVGWENCGEFGEDIRYVCPPCVTGGLQASNGSSDPRWCGVYGPHARDWMRAEPVAVGPANAARDGSASPHDMTKNGEAQ